MSNIMDTLLQYEELQQWVISAESPAEMTQRLLKIKQKLGNEFQQFSFYISRINQEKISI